MSHIMVWRGPLPEDGLQGFWHHGVRCTDETVIHYSGMDGVKTLKNGTIQRTSMAEFAVDSDREVHTVEYNPSQLIYSEEEIVRRAESRIGEGGYDLIRHNCENFARWCVIGRSKSFQVEGAVVGVIAAVTALSGGTGILAGMVTGLVAQRAWDAGRNISRTRQRFNEDRDTLPPPQPNSSNDQSKVGRLLITSAEASSNSFSFSSARSGGSSSSDNRMNRKDDNSFFSSDDER